MVKYVIKRLVLVLFTTFIILSLSFILYKSLPIELPMGKPEQVSQFLNEQYILGYVVRFTEPTAGYGDPALFQRAGRRISVCRPVPRYASGRGEHGAGGCVQPAIAQQLNLPVNVPGNRTDRPVRRGEPSGGPVCLTLCGHPAGFGGSPAKCNIYK